MCRCCRRCARSCNNPAQQVATDAVIPPRMKWTCRRFLESSLPRRHIRRLSLPKTLSTLLSLLKILSGPSKTLESGIRAPTGSRTHSNDNPSTPSGMGELTVRPHLRFDPPPPWTDGVMSAPGARSRHKEALPRPDDVERSCHNLRAGARVLAGNLHPALGGRPAATCPGSAPLRQI